MREYSGNSPDPTHKPRNTDTEMRKHLEHFDADRDRPNPKKARELFDLLWPSSVVRRACLNRLAQSIRTAHAVATASWSVTMFDWGVRLIVGQVLVLQLESDEILLYVRSRRGKSLYAAVDVPSHTIQVAPTELTTVSSREWKAHERFIRAAAEAKKISPFKASFSEGVLT